jgi:predicted MFS family arabinose efflux permease
VPLALLVATVVFAHTAYNGTRLNIALAALAAGASPLTVGVMMSLIAALPMLLGIFAGRLVDRVGVRLPLTAAAGVLVLSIALPGVMPDLPAFFVACVGMGTSFMLVHICAQHMVGEMSTELTRRDNFGWLALGFGISNLIGPSMTGYAIDRIGNRATFFILTGFALCAFVILLVRRGELSHTHHAERSRESRSALDLLRSAELRRVFLVSGMLASAWDMYTFVMPIYGTQIGLSATTIGMILASFAAATFTVRLMLPVISRHVSEWPLITITFVVACIAYMMFPFVQTVALLASISFFLGLGLGATQPSIMALLYATAPAGRAAEAVGVRTVVLNASSTLLPLVFGGLGTALGMATVFWTMSGALAGGGIFANGRRVARAV